jgi:hypothetical protein
VPVTLPIVIGLVIELHFPSGLKGDHSVLWVQPLMTVMFEASMFEVDGSCSWMNYL